MFSKKPERRGKNSTNQRNPKKGGGRRQRSEVRGQRTESSTTLSFPQVFSGNPEDVMVPR